MRFTPLILPVLVSVSCSASVESRELSEFRFQGKPIHPGAIQLLVGYLADPLPVITAVELEGWGRSNECHAGSIKGMNFQEWESSEHQVFGYEHIGTTKSGTHVLTTYDYGPTGSGVWEHLILVRISVEKASECGETRNRTILKAVGGTFLGDREGPLVSLKGNRITIAPGRGSRASMTECVEFDAE